MVPCCIGCLSVVDDGDGSADGGAICPKCGPRAAAEIVRRPETSVGSVGRGRSR
jgi:hypothetical protein